MPEWWTYRLSDFLMFAPRTYYRLFELYNAEIWPAQIATIVAGLGIIWLIQRGTHGRVVTAMLAAAWIFVASAYHWERYASINIAAPYYAVGFAVQAMLLAWTGVRRDSIRFDLRAAPIGYFGFAILIAGVVLYPLLALLAGRPWGQAEVFGIAPDPTAIATIGALLAATGRVPWLLLALPILWCAISGATLWTMDAPDAALPALVLVVAMGLAVWKSRRHAECGNLQA